MGNRSQAPDVLTECISKKAIDIKRFFSTGSSTLFCKKVHKWIHACMIERTNVMPADMTEPRASE